MRIDELINPGLKRSVLHGIAHMTAADLGLKPNQVKPTRDLKDGPDVVKFRLTVGDVDPRKISDKFVDALIAEFKRAGVKARFDGVEHEYAGRKYVDTIITASFSVYPGDEMFEAKRESNWDLRHRLLARKDDISKALGKVMKKRPVVWVFGEGDRFRNLLLYVTWYLPARQTDEDDQFWIHMARIAAVAEVKKHAPDMVLHKEAGSPPRSAKTGIEQKITFTFKRKA